MTVVISQNKSLELLKFEFSGAIPTAQMDAVFAWQTTEREGLIYDAFNIIAGDAVFVGVTSEYIDAHFERYRQAYSKIEFYIRRRAAWVCHSETGRQVLALWL